MNPTEKQQAVILCSALSNLNENLNRVIQVQREQEVPLDVNTLVLMHAQVAEAGKLAEQLAYPPQRVPGTSGPEAGAPEAEAGAHLFDAPPAGGDLFPSGLFPVVDEEFQDITDFPRLAE
jgi:hypothetical protein